MRALMNWLQGLWRRYNASPRRRVLELGLIGLSFALMIRILIASLSQINRTEIHFNFMPVPLALSAVALSVIGGTLGWSHIVRALHPDIAYTEAVRYHLLSVAAKYFPGFGWQQVSKMIQLNRSGVSLKSSALPVALELSLLIVSGFFVAFFCIISLPMQVNLFSTQSILVLGLCALGAIILAPLLATRWVVLHHQSETPNQGYVRILLNLFISELLLAVSWICLGAGLWFTSLIFYNTPDYNFGYFVLTTIISFMVSLAVIFVPNGFGIREVTLTLLLQVIIPEAAAVACALMFRFIIVLVEVACLSPVPFLMRRKRSM